MNYKRIVSISATVLIIAALSGCSNPLVVNKAKVALQPMVENPVPGFTLTETIEPTCGFDYCNVNPTYVFSSDSITATPPVFCNQLMRWAIGYGVDSWFFDPEFIAIPLEGHEASYLVACALGEGALLGTSDNGLRFSLAGNSKRYEFSTLLTGDGELEDSRLKRVEWSDAVSQLSDGFKLNLALFDAVNTYRANNPAADPSSEATITDALKSIPERDQIKLMKNDDGAITHLKVPADDFLLERCLNIKPFDEEFFGVINPINGIFGTFIFPESEPIDQFGAMGECANP